ncbi:hypothetical protein LOTGIDRAFT_121852 [Lottia gigantea]|uniref:Ig-like domain-containing protein n=1 Tax=Lottia gigantea TaxID=225164 RepID=V4A9P4_LOTGI|nr:hypothetical protein LOTGIDRAFT_121852 [Lottia gigantea]ESO91795.1 hypothetical protein LOTGIDRAFT_121852 [Lottia gigantea]
MSCVFCKPNAKLKWFKSKMEIFHSHKHHFEVEDNKYTLIINNVKLEDGGKYTCQCNKETTSAWLYVEDPEWEFMKKLEDVEAVEREKAIFECDVSDPEAEVSWFRDEKELKSGGKYEFIKDNLKRRLVIKNCNIKDDGKYSCKMLGQETSANLFVGRKYKNLIH